MRFGLFRVAGMRLVFPESQRHAVESTELIFRKSQDGKRPSQRTARRLLLGDRNRWPALPPAQWVERLQNELMNFLNLPFDFRTRFIYRLPPACFEQNDFGLLFFWQTFMPSRIFSCRPLHTLSQRPSNGQPSVFDKHCAGSFVFRWSVLLFCEPDFVQWIVAADRSRG